VGDGVCGVRVGVWLGDVPVGVGVAPVGVGVAVAVTLVTGVSVRVGVGGGTSSPKCMKKKPKSVPAYTVLGKAQFTTSA
jgi:hypothetical protein